LRAQVDKAVEEKMQRELLLILIPWSGRKQLNLLLVALLSSAEHQSLQIAWSADRS